MKRRHDERIISLLGQGKAIVTVEDHRLACGFGSGLLEAAAAEFRRGIPKPITMLGVPNEFIKHNFRKAQLMEVGVNAEKIVETVKEMLES